MKEDILTYDEDDQLQTGEFVPSTGEILDEDVFKILIATDIHLGFCENDPERENDSFTTFEEILELAKAKEVDFVLLGGDLFHENKPKPNILRRTTELCRKHCLGNRPVCFEYIGVPERDFPNQADPEVNYYDPNINIALPIFTIHGNHDDPIGTTKTSAVDHLAAAKLVNHFGQWNNLNHVVVSPVLLTKGETKLALYGLGYMKDERLHRLMHDNKVEFVGPEEDTESWFNMFVIHQNRVKHGPKSYIPENYIPGYMHFVLWGHEHECMKDLHIIDHPGRTKTHFLQAGSSVATSLCAGEAVDKHVFVVRVHKRRFQSEAIPLQTVRPLVLKDLMVKDILHNSKLAKNASVKERSRYLEKYVEGVVNKLIEDSEDKLTGHEKQPVKPLVRVRLFHDDSEEFFNAIRFGQRFSEKVANEDILIFKKMPIKREGTSDEIDVDDIAGLVDQEDDDIDSHVEAIVEKYFAKAREEGETDKLLEVLGEHGVSEAVKCAVEKDDDKAISVVIENQIEKVVAHLINKNITEDTLEDELERFRDLRTAMADQERKDLETILGNIRPNVSRNNGNVGDERDEASDVDGSVVDEQDDESIEDADDHAPSSSRRGGRGSRGTRGRGRGRGRGKAAAEVDVGLASQGSSSSTRARGRGASSSKGKAATKNTTTGRNLVQTTLNVRRSSPRKPSPAGTPSKGGMNFDDDDDSD